jgi:non-specific serine/threonine protein kinase/serine/threonine-protein kinase
MPTPRWQRIFEVFDQALAATEGERQGRLDEACAGDPELRREVDRLLAAHGGREGPLDRPAPPLDGEAELPPDARVGESLGPYRILRLLGEGGMGSVYEAEQQEPLRRRVAVKLIKVGMDTRELMARFEVERRTLALLAHPAIAAVHDAGATPLGRPFFVMELVDGPPIDEYCDGRRASVRERLELLLAVCRGVEHAHRRGVLHRDLKPSNVLIAELDGRAQPKIIDFGIAKLMDAEAPATRFTQRALLLGTPEYMSPEQADWGGEVDTRSDVYSLGVLLYRLLSGSLPFDAQRLHRAGLEEVRRILHEEEPAAPSTRVSPADDASAGVARDRGTDPRSLQRLLVGDLDWVVAKAIAKERGERYGSVSELAADLERYLRGEPVQAGPPGRLHRLSKLVRRHRAAVLAGGAVFASLLAALLATGAALGEARRARAAAEEQTAVAEAVNRFLNEDLLAAAAPDRPGDRELTMAEVLDRAAAKLEPFAGPPAVEAAVRQSLANAQWRLGRTADALPHFERALELRRRALGPGHAQTLRSTSELATVYRASGRLDEAQALVAGALPLAQQTLGGEDPEVLALLRVQGRIHQDGGRLEAAEATYRDLLARAESGRDDKWSAIALSDLGIVLHDRGSGTELDLAEKVYEVYRRLYGEEHQQTAQAMSNLAIAYVQAGREADAEPLLRTALERNRVTLGAAHPRVLGEMINYSGLLRRVGRLEEAEPLAREAYAGLERAQGPHSLTTLVARVNWARILRDRGRLQEAAGHLEGAVALARLHLSPALPWLGRFASEHGQVLASLGRGAEAEALLLEAHGLLVAAVGLGHEQTAGNLEALAALYERAGRPEEAGRWRALLASPDRPPEPGVAPAAHP